MEAGKKLPIIRRFLQERSIDKQLLILEEKALLKEYDAIGVCLDWIEEHASDLFDPMLFEDGFKSNLEKWRILSNILDHAVTLKKGSPPVFKTFKPSFLQERVAFWQRDLEFTTLPGCDFYNRKTTMDFDVGLNKLFVQCREKISAIISPFLPALAVADQDTVREQLKEMNLAVNKMTVWDPDRLLAQQKLNILTDLYKINSLRNLEIPQDDGSHLSYFSLMDTSGGALEKISLITKESVVVQLSLLNAAGVTTLDEYSDQRDQFKLTIQAILKLPKQGDAKEVQREAMALNISRMLGLMTTRSTMVSHQGLPALFIPLDDIRLLKEVATVKTRQARLFLSKQYTHYSMINPVGEGLQSNRFIDDFGHGLGLFYLCSDTDVIGGDNQKKGLKENGLYIFDQVLTHKNKLGLDSGFSIKPIRFLNKHTQHNRTLIEDASIDSSFASMMQLKKEQKKLTQYCAQVAFIHSKKIRQLEKVYSRTKESLIRKELREEIKLVRTLMNDARTLKAVVHDRIKKIDDVMPSSGPDLDLKLIKQTFIVELLLNKPILFADDGRPYQFPWTNRNKNRAFSIMLLDGRPEFVKITFDKHIPEDVLAMIRRLSNSDSPIRHSKKELLIRVLDLQALNEASLFPEQQGKLVIGENYLHPDDLDVIKKAYGEGHQTKIIKTINKYRMDFSNHSHEMYSQLNGIRMVEMTLKEHIASAKDKGFGMHVLRKFHFDVQQKLQQMMRLESLPAQITEAFNAALLFDQVSQFNAVVITALKKGKVTNPVFLEFLDLCLDKVRKANDHFSAKVLSAELDALANTTIQTLKKSIQKRELADLLFSVNGAKGAASCFPDVDHVVSQVGAQIPADINATKIGAIVSTSILVRY